MACAKNGDYYVLIVKESKVMVTVKNIDGEVLKVFEDLDTLAGADLSYEELPFADFSGMDLTDTDFTGADIFMACLDDAILDGTIFTDTYYDVVMDYGGFGGHHKHIRGY